MNYAADRPKETATARPRAHFISPALISRFASFVLLVLFLASTLYYLVWRIAVINWWFWWIGVPLLLAELFGILNTLGLLYTAWPRPAPLIAPRDDPARFPIYLLIPTVNEGTGVLEPTLRGALAARDRYLAAYPQAQVTIVLCNDGKVAGVQEWRDVEALAARFGVECVTRTVPGGAKAGNIEYVRQAIGATGDTLIALFDADMAAEPEFLLKTIPPFADPTIGWVQTGQYYRNQSSVIARWAHDQQLLFYRLICVGKAAVNGAFICGTNVVIRAAALDTIGGLPQNSVTEDLAASILLHTKWRSLYLTDVLALGLGPEDLNAYFTQQRRWATGTFGVLFRHWRAMLLPWHRGLTLPQRLQYLYCCIHFFSGFRDLICIAAPLAYLCLGIPAFRTFGLSSFLLHFFPYWLFSLFVFWFTTRKKASFRTVLHGSILGFGCFPIFISAFANALVRKRIRFVITAKRRQEAHGWQHLYPQALLLAVSVAGMCRFARAGHHGWLGLVSELWMLYVVLMIAGMLWLGAAENPRTERRMRQTGLRFRPALIGVVCLAAGLFASQQVLGRMQILSQAPTAHSPVPLSSSTALAGDTAFLPSDSDSSHGMGILSGTQNNVAYVVNERGQMIGLAENGDGDYHDFPGTNAEAGTWPYQAPELASPKQSQMRKP